MRNLVDIQVDIDIAEDMMREAETALERVECFTLRNDLMHEHRVAVHHLKSTGV